MPAHTNRVVDAWGTPVPTQKPSTESNHTCISITERDAAPELLFLAQDGPRGEQARPHPVLT